jgi:hypothetical protein
VFIWNVWRDIFKLTGIKLWMSMAFHLQTNGQFEVLNKKIPMYLWCITGDWPRAWLDWLP